MTALRVAVLGGLLSVAFGCGDTPAPTAEGSNKPAASSSAAVSAKPVASIPTPPASATASEAPPPASATAAATPSAALIPSEAPAATAPTTEEFAALTTEVSVKQSSVQKCSTKVLKGWFELNCPEAEGLVRATKVDLLSGFDAKQVELEAGEGKTLRWVAALPADGSKSQARLWGKGLHEIFLTLENTDKGWKGELSGKKP